MVTARTTWQVADAEDADRDLRRAGGRSQRVSCAGFCQTSSLSPERRSRDSRSPHRRGSTLVALPGVGEDRGHMGAGWTLIASGCGVRSAPGRSDAGDRPGAGTTEATRGAASSSIRPPTRQPATRRNVLHGRHLTTSELCPPARGTATCSIALHVGSRRAYRDSQIDILI